MLSPLGVSFPTHRPPAVGKGPFGDRTLVWPQLVKQPGKPGARGTAPCPRQVKRSEGIKYPVMRLELESSIFLSLAGKMTPVGKAYSLYQPARARSRRKFVRLGQLPRVGHVLLQSLYCAIGVVPALFHHPILQRRALYVVQPAGFVAGAVCGW